MSINGFSELTHELTEYELTVLLPKVVAGLGTKKGKANAITNKKICKAMKERGFDISEVRVRKLVNYIRVNGVIKGLVATSTGYYIATSFDELRNYAQSLSQRKREIGRVEEAILKDLEYFKKNNQ